MAQKVWKKQNNSENLKKKNPTKKDIHSAIDYLLQKVFQIDNLLGLYLEYKKDNKKFNKFIENKVKEIETKGKKWTWHNIHHIFGEQVSQ